MRSFFSRTAAALAPTSLSVKKRGRTYTNEFTSLFEINIGAGMLSLSNTSMVTMPLTVRLAICKLAQFAQGPALEEIMTSFGFIRNYKNCNTEVPSITAMLRSFTILLINKIYVNDTRDLNPSLMDKKTVTEYGVHVQKMKFNKPRSATAYINRWVELVSLRRLPDVLSNGEVNINTSIVVLSAAHIKTTWEKPFNLLRTRAMKFRTLNNTVTSVQMMTRRDSFLYYHDSKNHFQIVSIPLISFGMTMTFLLPDGIRAFNPVIRRVFGQPGALTLARQSMRYTVVNVTLPKFRLKSTFEWDKAIKFFGVNQIFNSTHSGMEKLLKSHHETSNMHVSLVKQKVFLDMDEMGALRAGVPIEHSDELASHYPLFKQHKSIPEFTADQPFLFSIDMQVSTDGDQAEFILGVYYGPDSNN